MIKIKIPNNNILERKYIINILIYEFLGITYKIEIGSNHYEIYFKNGNYLIIEDHFFNKFKSVKEYLNYKNIPKRAKYTTNQFIPEKNIPIIYGKENIISNKNMISCKIDIFASSFFMLTRWEEFVNTNKDMHDRFLSKDSFAYKNSFLNRPIVNEYVELLWEMIYRLDKSLKRKKRKYRILLSHDVDHPFLYLKTSFRYFLRTTIVEIKNNINPLILFISYINWVKVRRGNIKSDTFYTFNFIIEENQKRGIKSSFYFLPTGSRDLKNQYSTDIPEMQELLMKIADSGHEIGIHGHYDTYKNKNAFLKDVNILRHDLKKAGLDQEIIGGRQHFLRWSTPETMRNYDAAGLKYDTSLSYPEVAGFRCGICYEFPFFDVEQRQVLNVVERPLIAMEASVILSKYMNKGHGDDAYEVFLDLKNKCKKYNGDFTLLWHNSFLITEKDRDLYLKVLDA